MRPGAARLARVLGSGLLSGLCLLTLPALLRADDRPTGVTTVVAIHGEWSVVVAETDRGKQCYAAGTPRRLPKGVSAEGAFVFVTTRPQDQVRDEFAAEFGYAPAGAIAKLGAETFDLATRDDGAWIRDRADEVRLIDAMRSNAHMTVHAMRAEGGVTVDIYSLSGFADELAQARRECADGALSN